MSPRNLKAFLGISDKFQKVPIWINLVPAVHLLFLLYQNEVAIRAQKLLFMPHRKQLIALSAFWYIIAFFFHQKFNLFHIKPFEKFVILIIFLDQFQFLDWKFPGNILKLFEFDTTHIISEFDDLFNTFDEEIYAITHQQVNLESIGSEKELYGRLNP